MEVDRERATSDAVFTETDIQIIKTPGWHNNLMPLPRRRRRDALLDGRGHHRRCEGPGAGIDTRGDQLVRARDLPGRPPDELPLRPAVRGRDRCELRPSERHYDEHLPHRALAQAAP